MRTDPGHTPPSAKSRNSAETSRLWSIAGMGTELAGGIVGMLLLGFLLDWWLGTKPWLTLTGAAMGIIGGGYNFIKRALAMNKAELARLQARHPQGLVPLEDQPDEPTDDEDDQDEWSDRHGS